VNGENFDFDINKDSLFCANLYEKPELEPILGLELNEFSTSELNKLRLEAYQAVQARGKDKVYLKVHDAYFNQLGLPLIQPKQINAALYIVRNPFDCVFSYANQIGYGVDESIDLLAKEQVMFDRQNDRNNTPILDRFLGSWSTNVLTWSIAGGFPKLVVRYEDMVKRPEQTFSQITKFLGFGDDLELVREALRVTSFSNLKSQEEQNGFEESEVNSAGFFRKGQVGEWVDRLSTKNFKKMVEAHGPVMRHLGYLDTDNKPTELIV
jgi:hypothetical protein